MKSAFPESSRGIADPGQGGGVVGPDTKNWSFLGEKHQTFSLFSQLKNTFLVWPAGVETRTSKTVEIGIFSRQIIRN